ncbi:shugoshin family protein [Sporobolomyces salmoneus]|uniref:shugoshin family protein n=1 Tax=Sporobolomyces salmoneus TaxID=183962 RepID=UPI00317FCD12
MMTTRRLSGMPQQSNQQFGTMLAAFEAFRKKHQAQNKEIITKNSELHKTNAELLQHRSVIQAQNLSLKGTLLQTEAELLNVKNRLHRSEENEKDLREQLERTQRRGGVNGGVNEEQVEVMRQALAAAMTALQAFQTVLAPTLPTRQASPSFSQSTSASSSTRQSQSSRCSRRPIPTTQSLKVSLSDRPGSMNLSNRLLIAEAPELSLIDEGEGEVDLIVREEEGPEVRSNTAPLPLPLPIPSTSSRAQSSSPPLPSSQSSSTSTKSRPLLIAKSLQPRSTPGSSSSSTFTPSSSQASSSRSTSSTNGSRKNSTSILESARDYHEDAQPEPEPTKYQSDDRDEEFAPSTSTTSSSRSNSIQRRRKSGLVPTLDTTTTTTSGSEGSPETTEAGGGLATRPSRRKELRQEEEEGIEPELEIEQTPEVEVEHVRAGEKSSRSARRRSILPSQPSTVVEPGTRENDEREVEQLGEEEIPLPKPSATSKRTPIGENKGSAMLQARKESIKREKEALKASQSSLASLEGEEQLVVEVEPERRRGRSRTPVVEEEERLLEQEEGEEEPVESRSRAATPSESQEDELAVGGGGRRARKSVNYALPKLNTKMRRPEGYVPVTSTNPGNKHPKPRRSTKPAPRSSSTTFHSTIEPEAAAPPLPTSISEFPAVSRPSLAGKRSKPPFKPVPPPISTSSIAHSRYLVDNETDEEEPEEEEEVEEENSEWNEPKLLETLGKTKKARGTGVAVGGGSRRSSQAITA